MRFAVAMTGSFSGVVDASAETAGQVEREMEADVEINWSLVVFAWLNYAANSPRSNSVGLH